VSTENPAPSVGGLHLQFPPDPLPYFGNKADLLAIFTAPANDLDPLLPAAATLDLGALPTAPSPTAALERKVCAHSDQHPAEAAMPQPLGKRPETARRRRNQPPPFASVHEAHSW
jgi:hypothetical protein